MSKLTVSIVPADGIAPSGAWTSAVTAKTCFESLYIHVKLYSMFNIALGDISLPQHSPQSWLLGVCSSGTKWYFHDQSYQ